MVSEVKLTEKQKRFADDYIIHGNATEAYKTAYPSVKKDSTARTNGSRLLTNANISEYIKERLDKIEDDRLMSVEEALILSSELARGKTQKGVSKTFDKLENATVKDIEYEFTPDLEARQKAIEHILKVNGVINGKLALEKLQKEIELLAKKIEQLDKTDETSTENNLANALIKIAGGQHEL